MSNARKVDARELYPGLTDDTMLPGRNDDSFTAGEMRYLTSRMHAVADMLNQQNITDQMEIINIMLKEHTQVVKEIKENRKLDKK
jgi:hypothetical protein